MEIERQQLRIRQPYHRGPGGLRQGSPVDELRVGEVRVPVEVVVDRVIDAAGILAAEIQVHTRHAQVIQKGGVVGARTQRVNPQVRTLPRFLPLRQGVPLGARNAERLQPLPDGSLGFRIFDIARHAVDELLQRVRALHLQNAPSV